jgi:hypothetical protein
MLKPFMKLCINAIKTDERMLHGSDSGILMVLKQKKERFSS